MGRWCRSMSRIAPDDRGRITRGLDRLTLAADARGSYLPQAVIAALHATAPSWQQTDWSAICVATTG
jgi:RNA polymerase sigma-70 factor (ECF subfamily)